MATDSLASLDQRLVVGNNFHLCVNAENESEVDRLFHALSSGGKIEMPVNKTFLGSYFGMFTDKFGIQWMISFSYNQKQGL